MFKIIKKCPLCGSTKKSEIVKNDKNIYSYFLSKILYLNEDFILKNMQNYKCKNCGLIYKKKWIYPKSIKKIYKDYQPTHPGGLNTLKKNFGKKKFLSLVKECKFFFDKGNYEISERKKREIIKILNSTDNNKNNFLKLKKKYIRKLYLNDWNYLNQKYLILSNMINKPKIYSQFSGFRSHEVSAYLNKSVNLRSITSYAEVGCPLWGNYYHFRKPWIKQYFLNIEEKNFWKADKKKGENCLRYLSKKVKIVKKKSFKKIDFVGIYNFLDHVENPLKLFNTYLKNVEIFGIICEDIDLSKKIDCQHFSSWSHKSLKFLSKKIGYTILKKPFRLSNSIFKFYVLKKIKQKTINL